MNLSTLGFYLFMFLIGFFSPYDSTPNFILGVICFITLMIFKMDADKAQKKNV